MPLLGQFEIAAIGSNESGSVVPDEWMGRVFESGQDCHSHMDQLAWRQGKPPVCYCITPGLMRRETHGWSTDFAEARQVRAKHGMRVVMFVAGKGSVLGPQQCSDELMDKMEQKAAQKKLKWRVFSGVHGRVLVVSDLVKDEADQSGGAVVLKKERVALLASTMQKAIR